MKVKMWNWILKSMLLVVAISSLCGCKRESTVAVMRNVEERDYATILLVSEGEEKLYQMSFGVAKERRRGEEAQIETISSWECNDFEELEKQYQTVKGKELSLSHLKVILLSFEDFDITQFKPSKTVFYDGGKRRDCKDLPGTHAF